MTADDIERVYASVDPSRGLQLNEAVQIIAKASKSERTAMINPFATDAEPGQYAIFLGPEKTKLKHVIHAEVISQ